MDDCYGVRTYLLCNFNYFMFSIGKNENSFHNVLICFQTAKTKSQALTYFPLFVIMGMLAVEGTTLHIVCMLHQANGMNLMISVSLVSQRKLSTLVKHTFSFIGTYTIIYKFALFVQFLAFIPSLIYLPLF